jgi:hypothetical protein
VAVEKWDMTEHEEKYPRACKVQKLVDTPEKVRNFLVGRQFFVIFVIFLIAQITAFPDTPEDFAGLPAGLIVILQETGLPGVAIVLTYGQLISQLFVEEFTIPFMNLPGCYSITMLGLGTEYSGLCHFAHLLYNISRRTFCGKIMAAQETLNSNSNLIRDEDGPQSAGATQHVHVSEDKELTWFDYIRYIGSTLIICYSVTIVAWGIAGGKYVLPIPPAAAFVVYICALIGIFYLEGLMIAIVATQYWDRDMFKESHPRAWAIHELVNRPDHVKRFVIGRQFCTVCTSFLLATTSTFANWEAPSNIPAGLFFFGVQSGLVGVMIVLTFGQLCPELLAAEYPLCFMDMMGSLTITRVCIFFDRCGVGHAAWLVYHATKSAVCRKGGEKIHDEEVRPDMMRVASAELLARTGDAFGGKPPLQVSA